MIRPLQRTVALPAANKGRHPLFIVDDLQQHDTFRLIPCVAGPPYFRYYAGTPLTTAKGINIGSFYVIDPRPNLNLTPQQRETLGILSEAVIEYLDTSRQAIEGGRLMKLLTGLSSFVQGSSSFEPTPSPGLELSRSSSPVPSMDKSPSPTPSLDPMQPITRSKERKPCGRPGSDRALEPEVEAQPHPRQPQPPPPQPPPQLPLPTAEPKQQTANLPRQKRRMSSHASDSSSAEWVTGTYHPGKPGAGTAGGSDEMGASSRRWTFKRAANIIRESLDLGEDGGVLLVDVNSPSESDGSDDEIQVSKDYSGQTRRIANVLALSTQDEPFFDGHLAGGSVPAAQIDRRLVRKFLARYPKGGMWYFHGDGSPFTSDSEWSDTSGSDRKSNDSSRASTDSVGRGSGSGSSERIGVSSLKKYFPRATRIIWAPLWDSLNSRWFGGCFCWSGMETRVFSSPVELGSVMGFGSSLMVEYSRIESQESDRRKGDFLSSISYVLRRSAACGKFASMADVTLADTNSAVRCTASWPPRNS